MRRSTVRAMAALGVLGVLGGAACGGEDDGGGGSPQAEVAELTEEFARDELGLEVDRDCLDEAAGELSDDDARAILEAGIDGQPELSAEGEELGDRISDCFVVPEGGGEPSGTALGGNVVDLIVEQLEATGLEVDRECLEEALAGQNLGELSEADANDPEFVQRFIGCVDA